MAGRLSSPFPLSSSHTPPRVYYCYYHHCPPHVYFSLLWHLPRVSRPMRERTADGIVLPHPLVRLPLCERGSSFSSIAFGYRGINYPLVPSVHYLPSCICPLEIVRGKRIPFSPVRTLHSRELLDPSTRLVAVWQLERSVLSMYCFLISVCFT